MHASVEAGALKLASPGPAAVPPDLPTILVRVSQRLRRAAAMAELSADGTNPEWGAELVLDVLDGLQADLDVLRSAAASSGASQAP